jgi:hypothetical protein
MYLEGRFILVFAGTNGTGFSVTAFFGFGRAIFAVRNPSFRYNGFLPCLATLARCGNEGARAGTNISLSLQCE